MSHKKGKPKPHKEPEGHGESHDRPKHGIFNAVIVSGWVQNTSVAILVVLTTIFCLIMKMSPLKTGVVTACVLITALVWMVGLTIVRKYDTPENPPFAVAIETAYIGETRNSVQIACLYNQRYFSPVAISMFVRIVNMQDTPAKISLFRLEVESQRRRWLPSSWLQLKRISDDVPLIWFNPPPAEPVKLELVGARLLSVLEQPIPAHSTVWGWILFDAPAEYDAVPHPIRFRVSIKDTAGQRFTRDDPTLDDDNIADPPRGWQTGAGVNLSGFIFRHWADPAN